MPDTWRPISINFTRLHPDPQPISIIDLLGSGLSISIIKRLSIFAENMFAGWLSHFWYAIASLKSKTYPIIK
jgi:hypothetical protein